jgi:hypothetical protein
MRAQGRQQPSEGSVWEACYVALDKSPDPQNLSFFVNECTEQLLRSGPSLGGWEAATC